VHDGVAKISYFLQKWPQAPDCRIVLTCLLQKLVERRIDRKARSCAQNIAQLIVQTDELIS
jgi:hypothetical protein